MKIYGVRVFVDDFDVARAFYGATLGLEEVWAQPEIKAVGFQAGAAQLIVEEVAPDGEDAELLGRFVGLSLQVDDIQSVYDDLRAKQVSFHGAPEKQVWGGTLAHFDDPAGNTLTLIG